MNFSAVKSIGIATFAHISRNNLGLIAAGVAFYSMLSVFPALAALIAVLSLIANPSVVIVQLEEVRGLMPDAVYNILNTQIVGLVSTSSDTLGWAGAVSLGVALWSARAGVGSMMHGLNLVYDKKGRATLKHYLRALILTVCLLGVGVVSLVTVVVAPIALSFIPLGGITSIIIEFLRWSVAIVVIFAGIGLLYRFGPNRKGIRIGWLTPGAVMAGTSWAVLSIAFSYYVAHFGNYNEVYGSIGAVIAMLIWLWISAFLVLLGAALNAEIEKQRAAEPARQPDPVITDVQTAEVAE
ncbi:YihY/virulence factor BrkB family protein [Roseobacter sp. YSTF-M11]|uniref:YihY/virulence factor BrkB family protein n=1 Tax=Roseobacter insulae TaxID=2859783 RepID=A0A9X1K376_9RHOB|nr:YihY/virulence factor BrkB family protein [Roseobacter insulae]MBW4708342.1 YihY/virulence factor BrkB family protein [Roseobacter insulae]